MADANESRTLSNADIADRLSSLAQMLTMEKANPYKVRAYRRAAAVVRGLGESMDEMVRSNADLLHWLDGDRLTDQDEIVEQGRDGKVLTPLRRGKRL